MSSVEKTYISQGEFAVCRGENAVISTLLGSCVSACLWDSVALVGGMNHVLFADDTPNAAQQFGHGVNGMELLINGLLREGAIRDRMRAKVFGGASMISGLSNAGEKNGEFVKDFLRREGIANVGGDLGGSLARRLEFWPATGRARIKLVNKHVEISQPVVQPLQDAELF